ncbi:MAG: type IV secretory system conjugative DNA transfer family protein [Chthoniobacteraceae bacterium]
MILDTDDEETPESLLVKLQELEKELAEHQGETPLIFPSVDEQAVASVVADWTGIPVERRDFFLFIDEFHNFTTDAFATVLAEARKYRLCLALSHQYIDQLPLPVRQAVLGNVGSLLAFRIGNTDAGVISREFGNDFPPNSFVDLPRYEVLVKLMENGTTLVPFRASTLPPIENRVGRREKLIARSREKYAASRTEVESKLERWLRARDDAGPRVSNGAFHSSR